MPRLPGARDLSLIAFDKRGNVDEPCGRGSLKKIELAHAEQRRKTLPLMSKISAINGNAAQYPLPSWSDTAAKRAILDFVARVTNDAGPDFVPVGERIATFDNDGTLWCERPIQFQLFFALDRLAQIAEHLPQIRMQQPFKAFLEGDLKTLATFAKREAFEFVFATHAGMTPEEFSKAAQKWLGAAKHPLFGRLFTECVYRPQIELLNYLRANGFKTFIVTGGGIEFVRCFAEKAYGIPPEQVVGSSNKTKVSMCDGEPVLFKLAELNSFDDREEKVNNIHLHIGRRPILAFGNSDGDLAMMRYAVTGKGKRLALVLHHDDAEREFAYDRDFRLSPLAEALDRASEYGFSVVSMKRDWKSVFDSGD